MNHPLRRRCLKRLRMLVLRAAGAIVAFAFVLGGAELYLRFFPPSDLHDFLGAHAPKAGKLSPDPDFRIGFSSWDDLRQDNPGTLAAGSRLEPGNSASAAPWVFIGSSFAFDLCVASQRAFPDRPAMTLDRREKLIVRLAQIKTLLKSGCRCERIFLVTIPVDFSVLAEHSLRSHGVNEKGALVLSPRLPPGVLGAVVAHSRLALGGWIRLGLHRDDRSTRVKTLTRKVPQGLYADLDQLLDRLSAVCRKHDGPLTIVHVPSMKEIQRGDGFALEDTLVALCDKHGLDFLDLRPLFLSQPRREELYIPDGHLSDAGNALVVRELQERYPATHKSPPRPVQGVLTIHPGPTCLQP